MMINMAIHLLNTSAESLNEYCHPLWMAELETALQMGIEALEKQAPKKPHINPKPLKNENYWWICPNCTAHNHTMTRHNYCHHCGQKIDWSDVENV